MAGFLGGHKSLSFEWVQLAFGVNLNAFASFAFGTKEFPTSEVPMQLIVDRVVKGSYKATAAIRLRLQKSSPSSKSPTPIGWLMESNTANGKIVVVR